MEGYLEAGATISPCGRYRYRLWREWRGTHEPKHWHWVTKDGDGEPMGEPKACLFVMLNPSTADGRQDDPTIRRCVGFAKALKYERLEVVNLFAYRATKPSELLGLHVSHDPIGPENLEVITDLAANAGMIICAWGAHGGHLSQDETVLGWFDRRTVYALGLTRDGHPRHPLYLPATAAPVPFKRGVT